MAARAEIYWPYDDSYSRDCDYRQYIRLYWLFQRHRIQIQNTMKKSKKFTDGALAIIKQEWQRLVELERSAMKIACELPCDYPITREWLVNIPGVTDRTALQLLTAFDITKANTCSNFWSFAGMTPDKNGGRFNRTAAVVTFVVCTSIIMNVNKGEYFEWYQRFKQYEVERNESGDYAKRAAEILKNQNIIDKKLRSTLESGKLPPIIIDRRARRRFYKLILSHFFEIYYEEHYHKEAPKPYVLVHLGHVDYIPPINKPDIPLDS